MEGWMLLPTSDAALVRKALDDRPGAFEELVLRYQKQAHAIARAAGVSGAATDDAVQEAFLRAFENLPHLRSPESFGPWFLNIARNSARTLAQRLRRSAMGELGKLGEVEDKVRAPSLEQEEFKELLWRKVAELPEAVREAVFLYYHEGESVRAVAKSLRISRAAVLKRLERGRGLLREKLWIALEESIRATLPTAREWRRKGRRLAILLIGAVATSWGIRAAAPAAVAAAVGGSTAGGKAAGSGWLLRLLAGGMEMTARKIGVAVGLALLATAGGLYLFTDPFGAGGPAEADPAAAQARRLARSAAGAAAGTGMSRETDAAADTGPSGKAAVERPPSIFGRVTGPAGKGIPGARVIALPAREWDALVGSAVAELGWASGRDITEKLRGFARELARRGEKSPRTATDAAGEYHLNDLAAGEYRIIAGHGAHRPRTDGRAVVSSGEPVRLDLELAAGWGIAGRVIDEEGRPIPGASIAARRSSDRRLDPDGRKDRIMTRWLEGGFLLVLDRAVSGGDGAFRLGALDPVPHDLRVEKEGYATAMALDVTAGSESIEVVLSRGLTIRGRVLDSEKKPLEGAEVQLAIQGPEKPRPFAVGQGIYEQVPVDCEDQGLRAIATGASGGFEFPGLSAGEFTLTILHPRFPIRREEIRLAESSADIGDLVLEAPRAIHGAVLDARGAPIIGARVWIEESIAGGVAVWGGRFFDPPVLAETRSGSNGRFLLPGLREGVYTVHASSTDHAPAWLANAIAGGDPITIRLEEGLTLKGVVLDGAGGFPVAGAEVALGRGLQFCEDPEKRTVSGSGGAFTIRGIAADERRITIRVTHTNYPGRPGEAHLMSHQLGQPIEVRLFPAERIEGRVLDAAVNPAAGARNSCEPESWSRINVLRNFGASFETAQSAADGSFALEFPRFAGITRSALELVACHPALGIGRSGRIPAPPGGRPWPAVEVVLRGISSLMGTVADEAGRPVAGAIISAARKSSPEDVHALDRDAARSGTTGPSGAYSVAGLEPGSYQVEVRAQGRPRRIIDSVEVGAEPGVLDVALEAGTAIEGLAVNDAGQPVGGADVFVLEAEPSDLNPDPANRQKRSFRRELMAGIASARTDSGGRWRIAGLPERDLTLAARAPGHEASELQVVRRGEIPGALVLARLAGFSGVAIDAGTGKPVSSFGVFVSRRSSTASGAWDASDDLLPREFIDPRGMFRVDGLLPGSCIIAIRARGFAVWAERFTLAPGEELSVRAALDRGRILRGAVFDLVSGLPVPGARVSCWRIDRSPDDSGSQLMALEDPAGYTDALGNFAIPGMNSGNYFAQAQHPDFIAEKAPARITIGEGEPDFLRFGLLPGGALSGRIENLDGSRSIETTLVLKRADQDPARDFWWEVDREGRFHATSIPAGIYRVELKETFLRKAKAAGEVIRRDDLTEKMTPLGEIEIRAGEAAAVDFHLP